MDYLRRLQAESPLLFLVLLFVAIFVAFQVLLFVAELVLGPFGLPGWAPLALVLIGLIVVARRQQSGR
jgi:membrane-bound ClpP family serine protease